jgi:hypothetical protein
VTAKHAAVNLRSKPGILHVKQEEDILADSRLNLEADSSLQNPPFNKRAAEASENPA